jgi:hypothetical protein
MFNFTIWQLTPDAGDSTDDKHDADEKEPESHSMNFCRTSKMSHDPAWHQRADVPSRVVGSSVWFGLLRIDASLLIRQRP